MKTRQYRVLRQHYGDKEYYPGDSRELNDIDGKHLVSMGLLEDAEQKKEPEPSNKMETEPQNKARRSRKTKSED